MDLTIANEALEPLFTQQKNFFSKSVEPLSRNRDQNMTQNWRVCAICCQSKVDCDVVTSGNVKTAVGYGVVNFEVASSCSFRDN